MKIRSDFVTNSSSSCFIIRNKNYSEPEKIKQVLSKLINVHNEITRQNINIDDICLITNSKDREYINQLFRNECWGGEEGINCHLSYKDKAELDYPSCDNCSKRTEECKTYTDAVLAGDAVIFGFENAIPYELHDAIHWYLGANKYHLG